MKTTGCSIMNMIEDEAILMILGNKEIPEVVRELE
jgi:hypothetical protein